MKEHIWEKGKDLQDIGWIHHQLEQGLSIPEQVQQDPPGIINQLNQFN